MRFSIDYTKALLVLLNKSFPIWAGMSLLISLDGVLLARLEDLAFGDVVGICQVTDDYGSQTGLLISPGMFERYYRPWIAQAIDLVKSHDIKVFHHDDGAIRQLIPDFIELGIDVLNPIQWRCPSMEQARLAADFGGQVCFYGGVDKQHTLPFDTVEDVRAEVAYNLKTQGGRGTGYIVAPCHNIQANTSVENIVAMYESAHEMGASKDRSVATGTGP